jgi:Transglutaminase-like superfamily
MLLLRKLNSLFNQSFTTQLLLLPAWLMTGVARLIVLCVAFKNFAPALGRHHGTTALIPLLDQKQQAKALSIGRAVRMSSTLAPWNANCQAQAISARWLMGLFGLPYAVFYGVAKDPTEKMKAHAWLCAGPIQVTGGYAFDEFTVVAVFSNL